MSFLKPLQDLAPAANSAASGLGHLIDVEPSRISQIANSIGKVSNGIAAAGGATPGYDAPQVQPQLPLSNYMQLMDPRVLKALGASFSPRSNTVNFQ